MPRHAASATKLPLAVKLQHVSQDGGRIVMLFTALIGGLVILGLFLSMLAERPRADR
jgi:hypothetical protein